MQGYTVIVSFDKYLFEILTVNCQLRCSFVCDELDGRAARAFNQSSTFGAVLDMLTDRYHPSMPS